MLKIANNLNELCFCSLMKIYVEGNLEHGQLQWPEEPEQRQIALAEDDFYQYLREVFFQTPRAMYAMWQVDDQYVSALRLEPNRDGMLLEALETMPSQRGKGYAKALIQAVLEYVGDVNIYSHVSKMNTASLRTHEACGFGRYLNYTVRVDGSVMHNAYTLCRDGARNKAVATGEGQYGTDLCG